MYMHIDMQLCCLTRTSRTTHQASCPMILSSNAERQAKAAGAAAVLSTTFTELPLSLSCAATMMRSAGRHSP